jgi:acetyl esterase/lipase
MRGINLNYAGSSELLDDPVVFAANGEVSDFPPTFILNAEADDLRPSGEAFSAQLRQAGVGNRLAFEPGTVHGYLDVPGAVEALRSIDRMSAWIKGGYAQP